VLAARKGEPPLHAVAPFFGFVIHLACAVCTGILANAAVTRRAKVTVAIAVAISNVAAFVWFIFYLLLYDAVITSINI
jgi:hypothetical protein